MQMGYRRGGWYGYDRMDNDGIPSTVQVLQEWQHLKVGDSVPVWRNLDFPVVALKRINILFLRARINTTAWPNHTRLVWRFHLSPYNWACPSILAQPFTHLVVLVAVRQNLRGIKARAEGRRPQPEPTVYAELLMAGAGAASAMDHSDWNADELGIAMLCLSSGLAACT